MNTPESVTLHTFHCLVVRSATVRVVEDLDQGNTYLGLKLFDGEHFKGSVFLSYEDEDKLLATLERRRDKELFQGSR